MRWKILFAIYVTGLTLNITYASDETEKRLSSVNLFSPGFNGFVAKKMPQQQLYETALISKNATDIFERLLASADATPESKAYAACGLWKNKKADKIQIKKEDKTRKVTVLKGDVLRQDTLETVINGILSHGCE